MMLKNSVYVSKMLLFSSKVLSISAFNFTAWKSNYTVARNWSAFSVLKP